MSSNRSVMNSVSSAHNQGVPSAEGPGHYSLKTGSHIVSDRITQQGVVLDEYSSPGRALPAGLELSNNTLKIHAFESIFHKFHAKIHRFHQFFIIFRH